MDWTNVLTGVVSGTIMLAIGGIIGWLRGIINGKKKSELAIERKKVIYQPLIDELTTYSNDKWDIISEIKTPKLSEIIGNNYKYGLSEELLEKCKKLNDYINIYSQINTISIAHNIIVKIFKEAYERIYGSIIEGVYPESDRDGNEWETEVIALPVENLERCDFSKQIKDLIINEGMYNDDVCADYENALYDSIYRQLKDIYASVLYIHVNGKPYELPDRKLDLGMLPEEYMAYNFDFFERYNQNDDIKSKYRAREEIMYASQGIVQELKDIVEKIVRIYEVEQI